MKRVYLSALRVVVITVLIHSSPVHSQTPAGLMDEADSLWTQRKEAAKVEAAIALYKKVLELDAGNYDACWKIARGYFSLGNRLPGSDEMREYREKVGEQGMHYAKRALEIEPQGLEGHYYYALSLSQYSIGIGSFMTLAKGLGGEFETHMRKVLALSKYYDHAGPLRAMGRYFYYLPWPKRDLELSIQYLREAAVHAPHNIRGQVYLAESYLKKGKRELAKVHLENAVKLSPDLTREVDAQRWRERARVLLAGLTGTSALKRRGIYLRPHSSDQFAGIAPHGFADPLCHLPCDLGIGDRFR